MAGPASASDYPPSTFPVSLSKVEPGTYRLHSACNALASPESRLSQSCTRDGPTAARRRNSWSLRECRRAGNRRCSAGACGGMDRGVDAGAGRAVGQATPGREPLSLRMPGPRQRLAIDRRLGYGPDRAQNCPAFGAGSRSTKELWQSCHLPPMQTFSPLI